MTTQEQTAQHTAGPMEAWAVAHGVSIDARASATAFTRAVSLNDLLAFAREQDAIRAALLAALEGLLADFCTVAHTSVCRIDSHIAARAAAAAAKGEQR